MPKRELTAPEWDRLLRTDRGETIERTLARHRDRVIALTEPNSDALLRLRSALRTSRPNADVRPVRIDAFADDACALLAIRSQYALHCEPPVRFGRDDAQLRKMIAHPFVPAPRIKGTARSDGSFPWDAGVWYLLDLVDAIAHGDADELELSDAVVDALYAGNIPVGYRKGTDLFIVVAR